MDVQPMMDSIAAMPRTIIGLTQSVPDLPVYREITLTDRGGCQSGFIWDPA